jgi:hypothetical protein
MNSSTPPENGPSAQRDIPQTQPDPGPPSDHEQSANPEQPANPDPPSRGPNLVVLYALLALALIAAISFAAAIVWPFYLRR